MFRRSVFLENLDNFLPGTGALVAMGLKSAVSVMTGSGAFGTVISVLGMSQFAKREVRRHHEIGAFWSITIVVTEPLLFSMGQHPT
jgi:hypothetical protein